MAKQPLSKRARDNRANQLNPAHPEYYRSRGASASEAADAPAYAKATLDNRASQLNPNNDKGGRLSGVSEQPGSSSKATQATAERAEIDARRLCALNAPACGRRVEA
jgi:hypothetical protein